MDVVAARGPAEIVDSLPSYFFFSRCSSHRARLSDPSQQQRRLYTRPFESRRASAARLSVAMENIRTKQSRGLPSGQYRLRFQLGTDWLRERRFCRLLATSEFEDSFNYQEVTSDGGVKYGSYEVTLHPVKEGKARIMKLDNERFELPDP